MEVISNINKQLCKYLAFTACNTNTKKTVFLSCHILMNSQSNVHWITLASELVICIQKHLVGGYEVDYTGQPQ